MASRPKLSAFTRRIGPREDEQVFERIAAGWPMQRIADAVGCSRGLLYSFVKSSEQRKEKFAVARRISADAHAEAGLQILDEVAKLDDLSSAQVRAAYSRSKYRRWLATIADPDTYAAKPKVTGEPSLGELHLAALKAAGRMVTGSPTKG